MLAKRIIPCLDVKNGRVVKGINFVGLRDAGDPIEQARWYAEQGADELTFLDITASVEARGTLLQMVERVADTIFIPFTVGGGYAARMIFAIYCARARTRQVSTRRRCRIRKLFPSARKNLAVNVWWWRLMRKRQGTGDGGRGFGKYSHMAGEKRRDAMRLSGRVRLNVWARGKFC